MNVQVISFVRNVEKHSGATAVELTIRGHGDLTEFVLVDNGVGINKQLANHAGMGLRSMRERAVSIGGNLAIENGTDSGSTVRLTFPPSEGSGR